MIGNLDRDYNVACGLRINAVAKDEEINQNDNLIN